MFLSFFGIQCEPSVSEFKGFFNRLLHLRFIQL